MNAIEIEQAISELAQQPFDRAEFPYAFLAAFGNKETTLKRLRTGGTNKSDVDGLLQSNNIHIKVCDAGQVSATLIALRTSPATARARAKFILATDGVDFEAEALASGETVACTFADFPDHFGFFLPLAGISTVRQISENAFDIRATSRLNRLYMALLKDNPDWGKAERQQDMNKFMARLIFCFFAEDTDIFNGKGRFTQTLTQMSAADAGNTHEVLATLFRAMNTPPPARQAAAIPRWAAEFPYVNGQLFSGGEAVPRFGKIARTYLLHVGTLDWTKINPDIFGSMIQAVTEEDERGQLGMHYTSVPNILKVLNPLFLDDLRQKLAEAGENKTKLLNLRKRLSRIRVFDPACGSGNFLVIAYKQLREIEAEINQRRGEPDRASEIPLTNFRGIELRHFPAEIARLALIIAEYQCDVIYRGQKLALLEFLPLKNENWIVCGNALRLDWLSICPPSGTGVKVQADDLFQTPLDQAEIDFANDGGETYICGNPPYLGSTWQSAEQKADLQTVFAGRCTGFKSLDYVAGWFMKAADYMQHSAQAGQDCAAAFVATNSICQGQQVPILWPQLFQAGCHIHFAHTSFKWANLASHNAGVTVAIVGLTRRPSAPRRLYSLGDDGQTALREVDNINAYLVPAANVIVDKASRPLTDVAEMDFGNKPVDGGHFFLSQSERDQLLSDFPSAAPYVHAYSNSEEFINGKQRYCLWIEDEHLTEAMQIPAIAQRIDAVREIRLKSTKKQTQADAQTPYLFSEIRHQKSQCTIVVPRVSSENRPYLPVGLLEGGTIIGDRNFALYDAPLWNLALIASRLHLVWIATVCARMRTDFSYSNTLGWNTFPVPLLTEQNKIDLTRSAENILLTREAHFPATIADLYAEGAMPEDLRVAHAVNDETIERIYIGRRFKNDTERLEKLFDLYTRMTTSTAPAKGDKRKAGAKAKAESKGGQNE